MRLKKCFFGFALVFACISALAAELSPELEKYEIKARFVYYFDVYDAAFDEEYVNILENQNRETKEAGDDLSLRIALLVKYEMLWLEYLEKLTQDTNKAVFLSGSNLDISEDNKTPIPEFYANKGQIARRALFEIRTHLKFGPLPTNEEIIGALKTLGLEAHTDLFLGLNNEILGIYHNMLKFSEENNAILISLVQPQKNIVIINNTSYFKFLKKSKYLATEHLKELIQSDEKSKHLLAEERAKIKDFLQLPRLIASFSNYHRFKVNENIDD